MTLAEALMPAWFVLAVATATLVLLAGHMLALAGSDMEPRRKRIRAANNILMMLTTPLVAYGFGIVDPSDARAFVFTWTLVPALLLMIILLACADMLNTASLHRRERRALRARAVREAEALRSRAGG